MTTWGATVHICHPDYLKTHLYINMNTIALYLKDHKDMINTLVQSTKHQQSILNACEQCLDTLLHGNKIMICGNGGSAADSQHFAAELISKFNKERRSLGALALTTDTSILTAIGNDYSFTKVFSRQVEGLGNEHDLLIGISTSGESKNVIEAFKSAKNKNIKTLGLIGNYKECSLAKLSDCVVLIPSHTTSTIQEGHIIVEHIICKYIEDNIKT